MPGPGMTAQAFSYDLAFQAPTYDFLRASQNRQTNCTRRFVTPKVCQREIAAQLMPDLQLDHPPRHGSTCLYSYLKENMDGTQPDP